MLSNIELLPKDFKARELIQMLAPIIDEVTNKQYNKVLTIVRGTDADYINQEYIIKINVVYSLTNIFVENVDYTIEGNYITWLTTLAEGTQYYVDLDYLDSEVYQDFEYKDELLDKILMTYKDKSAALAYFLTMVRPGLGTLYCIENLIKIIQPDVNITIQEWYETTTLNPFKFIINFDDVPTILDVQAFIDYVFQLKNERSHLVRIGQDVCGSNTRWDYFRFDEDLYDDFGGVDYKGVKVCLQRNYKEYIKSDIQSINSAWFLDDSQYLEKTQSLNYFTGPFNDYGDSEPEWFYKKRTIGFTSNFYTSLIINGDMELDSNWNSFTKAFIQPSDTLYPSETLYPGFDPSGGDSTVTTNIRSSSQALLGTYSRYIEVINFGGIISNEFSIAAGTLRVNFWVYPLQASSIINYMILKDGEIYTDIFVPISIDNSWILLGGTHVLPAGNYAICIVGGNDDDLSYSYYIDEVEANVL